MEKFSPMTMMMALVELSQIVYDLGVKQGKKKSLEVWSSPDDKLFSLGPEQTNKLSCFHCRLQRSAGHTAHKNMVIFVSYRHQGLIPTTPPSSCNGKSLIWGEAASEGDFQPPIIQPSIRCDCAEQTEHKTITDDRTIVIQVLCDV